MRRMFDVWVHLESRGPGVYPRTWTIWIQCRRISAPHESNRLEGVAIRPLASGHGLYSAEYHLWLKYAQRTARGWNALSLAAELLDVRRDTPPHMLADLAWESGEHHLADEINCLFGLGTWAKTRQPDTPVSYPPPPESATGENGYIIA